jgi:hypothetical protein
MPWWLIAVIAWSAIATGIWLVIRGAEIIRHDERRHDRTTDSGDERCQQ